MKSNVVDDDQDERVDLHKQKANDQSSEVNLFILDRVIAPLSRLVDIFCWFDDPRSRLFATFRTNMCMLEIKPEIKNRIMTHDRAIVAARYLVKQKQVENESKRRTESIVSLRHR